MQPWERQRMLRREGGWGPESAFSPLGGRSRDTETNIHTWGAHSAWFCCIPAQSCRGWTSSDSALDTGQGEGRSPWLKEKFLPKLHQTTAPPDQESAPDSSYWKHPNQCFRSICKQPGMGVEGRGEGLRQQATKLEGRNPVHVSTPETLRIGLCFIPATLCVLLSTPADCRTIRTLAEHF